MIIVKDRLWHANPTLFPLGYLIMPLRNSLLLATVYSPTFLYSQWNVRNPDALIEVLESWMPLLPPWMFQNILDQLVNPKLQMEVDRWNPLTDTMPIHAWLHPWLPLMGMVVNECCVTWTFAGLFFVHLRDYISFGVAKLLCYPITLKP